MSVVFLGNCPCRTDAKEVDLENEDICRPGVFGGRGSDDWKGFFWISGSCVNSISLRCAHLPLLNKADNVDEYLIIVERA